MLLIQDVQFDIPALPKSWSPPEASSSSSITPPTKRRLIPVGLQYHRHSQRALHGRSFEEDDKLRNEEYRKALEAAQAMNMNGVDDLGVGDEPESATLLASDPKEWKKLDQYAILGLSHLRYKATLDQIRIAHRKKVLKHHPDKKAKKGDSNDDAFFKCISKATEVLTNTDRRRQFDSIDPYFQALEDEQIPPAASITGAKDPVKEFFRAFTPIYQREARFCKNAPESQVPGLGTYEDSKQTVEAFYDFWYNFDSWRSFEWFDKEVNEGSDNRDDKRYTEKKNKTERARRKKEDNTRLRQLVDLTMSVDPRIKRIKLEDKEERERKKRLKGGSGASTPGKTPQQKAEEERLAKEAAAKKEEEEKLAKAEAKKAKAAAANAAKKARRAARTDDAPA